MIKTNLILACLFGFLPAFSQQAQEPASGHYKTLQAASAAADPQKAWMDTLFFPPAEYGGSLTFVLVKPYYLTDNEVESLSASVTPPANSSAQTRKELDHLLEWQQKRTPEQKQRVEFLGNIGYWPQVNLLPGHPQYAQNLEDLFFEGREVNGEWCSAGELPAVARLLQGVMQDMRVMEFTVKYKYLRPRPYHLEPALQPMTRIGSPSFASGHTLWAFVQAYVWSEIVPAKREAFISLAEEIRVSREIMGIHYPSDNEASRQLAHAMLSRYFQNKAFRIDLQAAMKEWKEKSVDKIK